jgi:disulfide bond formation protein DsbB
MTTPGIRGIALLSAIATGLALGIALSLLAFVVPHGFARWLLMLVVVTMLVSVVLAVVHVGVELHYWPSPLPECAAPHFGGGSIAERLAQMPATPAKPCEDATFLIPGLPLSMAAMNLLYALGVAVMLGGALWQDRRHA